MGPAPVRWRRRLPIACGALRPSARSSNRLMKNRQRLGRDILPRGNPRSITEIRHPKFTATLFDLLSAYAVQRQQHVLTTVHMAKRTVWSLTKHKPRLSVWSVSPARIGDAFDQYLMTFVVDPSQRATVFALSFSSALELVREGVMDLNQKEALRAALFSQLVRGSRHPIRWRGRTPRRSK